MDLRVFKNRFYVSVYIEVVQSMGTLILSSDLSLFVLLKSLRIILRVFCVNNLLSFIADCIIKMKINDNWHVYAFYFILVIMLFIIFVCMLDYWRIRLYLISNCLSNRNVGAGR